jgi:ADP-ribosyl-[dinitrogen reductase] hydrolase
MTLPKHDRDRLRGMLLGLAIGDALGAAVEFRRPGTFAPVTGYRDGGPHGLSAGEWTDDTSMALAMAASLGQDGFSLNGQAQRYLAWYRHGEFSVNGTCFDIGVQTSSALRRFEESGDAMTCGDSDPQRSGNGSIMRLAPVVIWAHTRGLTPPEVVDYAAQSSIPTHPSDQCRSACAYLGMLLTALSSGAAWQEATAPDWGALRELTLERGIREVVVGSYRDPDTRIVGSGWVKASLEAALWAVDGAASFEEAVLRAVNLGDDADTTGAVAGQIAGARWGESRIPAHILEGLARRDMLETALRCVLK